MLWPVTVAIPVAGVAVLTDAASSAGFDPISIIGTVLTPTIVIILLLTGKLHTDSEVKRLEDAVTAKDAQLAALQSGLTDRVIPALTRATLVLETVSPLLQTDVHLRHDPSG